eukprot:4073240-Prymnesium_polylepis.1
MAYGWNEAVLERYAAVRCLWHETDDCTATRDLQPSCNASDCACVLLSARAGARGATICSRRNMSVPRRLFGFARAGGVQHPR